MAHDGIGMQSHAPETIERMETTERRGYGRVDVAMSSCSREGMGRSEEMEKNGGGELLLFMFTRNAPSEACTLSGGVANQCMLCQ
jgi:hypothetical protein